MARISKTEKKQLVRRILELKEATNEDPYSENGLIRQMGLHLQGKITQAQMVTSILRWEALEDARTYRLSLDPKIKIEQLAPNGQPGVWFDWIFGKFSADKKARALAELEHLPESERTVGVLHADNVSASVLKNKEPEFSEEDKHLHWFYHLKWVNSYPIKDLFIGKLKQREIVLPAFSLIGMWLRLTYGDEAVLPVPEIGKTNQLEIFESIKAGGRTLALAFPGVASERIVEGHLGKLMITLHDLAHCEMASFDCPSLAVRAVLGRFMDLLAPLYKVDSDGSAFWKNNERKTLDWLGSSYPLKKWGNNGALYSGFDFRLGVSHEQEAFKDINRKEEFSSQVAKIMLRYSNELGCNHKDDKIPFIIGNLFHFINPRFPEYIVTNPILFLANDVMKNSDYYRSIGLMPEVMLKTWGLPEGAFQDQP